jgi:uncharacterized protein YfkK (UPF0435 family)
MKSDYLYLEKDFVYTRLQGLIWAKSGLLSPHSFQQSAEESLTEIYENVSDHKPLVVSCRGIKEIAGNKALDVLFSRCLEKKRKIIFAHLENVSLRNTIYEIMGRNKITNHNDTQSELCICNDRVIPENLEVDIASLELDVVRNAVKDCYKVFSGGKKELVSTSILASGEFDATKIISNPKQFLWTSLLMADELEKLKAEIHKRNEENKTSDYSELKLISVSLRSSPFVSSVGLLTNTGYDTIDHLGPKHKLFDIEILENIKKNVLYIFIGDFVAGGTEIKVAQTYINLLDCKLKYAVAIGSLLKAEAFKEHFTLKPLIYLKQVGISDLAYELPFQN